MACFNEDTCNMDNPVYRHSVLSKSVLADESDSHYSNMAKNYLLGPLGH